MKHQVIRYLTSVEIEGEVYDIFIDQNFRFVAIWHTDTPELSDGMANVVWGHFSTFDSYESLVEELTQRMQRYNALQDEEEYEAPDPEQRHWDNVATFNERFSYD